MNVRIYQPSKAATQSALGRTQVWVLEHELASPRGAEPMMGWTSAADTLNQIRLRFPTREEAVAYAERKGWQPLIQTPTAHRVKPRNYADNFKPDPVA